MSLATCSQCGAALEGDICQNCGSRVVTTSTGASETVAPGRYFDDNAKFIPKLLADELMSRYSFATMMDSQETFVYLDGYYQPIGEVLIKKECKNRLQDEYRKNRFGEVLDFIKASTFTKRREELPNLIPLRNGVLDINTMELKQYSPELMFFNKTPVDYNPAADCPRIRQFHKEIVNGEEEVTLLEEVVGFSLYREYFIAKSLMVVGGGANGKSTWLSLVKRFLGHDNVSGRSLQDLEENRFSKADLHAKLANIYADLPDRALYRTGMFKMLTGRDLIAAEKKFQNSFHFENYAKLIWSANKVPEALDDTDAFFRRWIIITFPNVFNGENCDPHILEKLTTDEEFSGLLNVAIGRLKAMVKRGSFSYSKTTEALREEYTRKSSPIASFVMDCLETDSDAFIVKKELYNVFAEYCRQNSIPCVTLDTFYKNLPQHMVIADFRPQVEGRRYHSFKGARYNAEGVSNLSNLSRAFYTLIKLRDGFKAPWKVEHLRDQSYIKVGLALDRLDSLDTKQEAEPDEKAPIAPPNEDQRPPAIKAAPNLRDDLVTLIAAMRELSSGDGRVQGVALQNALGWGDVKMSAILGIAQRDGRVFRPAPGYWRLA